MTSKRPVILCILDGWGISNNTSGNAVALANTPCFDKLIATNPNASLITHGNDVGLPEGQMGNSEVGHMNIGAGRVVEMGLRRIETAFENDSFANLPALEKFIQDVQSANGKAHLCGVLSDGGVHSHVDHMIETAKILDSHGIQVVLHLFGDGRDVAPTSALSYLDHLIASIPESVKIASISGRYFALDRDNRWERVEKAFNVISHAAGHTAKDARAVIEASYKSDITDEFIEPTSLGDYAGITDGDGLLFLNFRADRAREILSAFADPDFKDFKTGIRPRFSAVTGMVEYSDRHNDYMETLFPSIEIKNTLGEWVSSKGLKQFRIAETEKYPHVTFFLNGGVEVPANDEIRYLAPSPKVPTYDLKPEMSSVEVTENLIQAIISNDYDLIVVNFANPDMVGHSGDLDAAILACESVDAGLSKVVDAVTKQDGAMIVCADHGNCEMMIDPETGGPHTAHTTNPVPVILFGANETTTLRTDGILADLAPTLLELMGLDQPVQMTGRSLIVR